MVLIYEPESKDMGWPVNSVPKKNSPLSKLPHINMGCIKLLIDGVSVVYKIVNGLVSINYIKILRTSTPIFKNKHNILLF